MSLTLQTLECSTRRSMQLALQLAKTMVGRSFADRRDRFRQPQKNIICAWLSARLVDFHAVGRVLAAPCP